ncbi:Uncharacterized protein YxjH [Grifola frondosa]|uniref:Uncharacterized protein YxjH n=1 Tax=Grifola frondosa TaxID=5627 RepID=A0A1C7M9F5_GRIFR|nr:Uncharacterized protein YxjH [Grifola frondosa]
MLCSRKRSNGAVIMSDPHLNPPFRAEQIGSLKRPAVLLQKRKDREAGLCSVEDLRVVEDEAIQAVLQMQREVGIKSLSDGEFRRHMFFDGVFDNMEGMKLLSPILPEMFMDYVPDIEAHKVQADFKGSDSYICVPYIVSTQGKLKRTRPFYVPQFEALKKLTTPEEHKNIKITMCAPEWFHLRHGHYAYPKEVYANDDEYFADIAVAYQEELKELHAAGCRNVQFDDPILAYFCADSMLSGMEARGVDHEALFNTYIRAYNTLLTGRPADMNVGLHLCRGNFKDGRHFSEGGYDRIAVKLFQEIDVDCYYLEYDTPRAGTFEPLRHLPLNKVVVLGLISTKLPQLEDVDAMVKRVNDAADMIASGEPKRSKETALNQCVSPITLTLICVSPQCGFASHSMGNLVQEDDVRRKLALVVRIAQTIWKD